MGRFKAGVLEGMLVLAAGAVLAAGGNMLFGSEGIRLGRDYFPEGRKPPTATPGAQGTPTAAAGTQPGTQPATGAQPDGGTQPTDPGTAADPGTQPADPGTGLADPDTGAGPQPMGVDSSGERTHYSDDKWFKNLDPASFGHYMGLPYVPAGQSPSWEFNELTSSQALAFHKAGADRGIVFVDARTADHFAEGHIPGAVLVSHFHFDRDWPQAQGQILAAGAIVIYCAGGDCSDSENLARSLILEGGLPQDRIYIYRGGVHDWTQAKRPFPKPSK